MFVVVDDYNLIIDKIKELNGGADPKPGDPASLLMLRHPSDKSRKSSNILGFGYGSKA